MSGPIDLHGKPDVSRHRDLRPVAHMRNRVDVCRHTDMYGDGHNMPRRIHMPRLDHLPGSEDLPRNGDLYRFDDLPELAHLHLDFDLSGQPHLQGHYHL